MEQRKRRYRLPALCQSSAPDRLAERPENFRYRLELRFYADGHAAGKHRSGLAPGVGGDKLDHIDKRFARGFQALGDGLGVIAAGSQFLLGGLDLRRNRLGRQAAVAREAFIDVVDFIAAQSKADPNAAYAGSVPYLLLTGNLVAGWQLGRALLAAEKQLAAGQDAAFMKAKIATARFYADHILTRVPGTRDAIVDGAGSVTALALESF